MAMIKRNSAEILPGSPCPKQGGSSAQLNPKLRSALSGVESEVAKAEAQAGGSQLRWPLKVLPGESSAEGRVALWQLN